MAVVDVLVDEEEEDLVTAGHFVRRSGPQCRRRRARPLYCPQYHGCVTQLGL